MINRGLIPRRVNESYNVRLRSDNLLCGEYVAVPQSRRRRSMLPEFCCLMKTDDSFLYIV